MHNEVCGCAENEPQAEVNLTHSNSLRLAEKLGDEYVCITENVRMVIEPFIP